jgi:hypothetical protein
LESWRNGKKSPLLIASVEGNENLFCFLYSSLASQTDYFHSNKSDIESYLLDMSDGCTTFVTYFQKFTDNFHIFSKVQSDFGFEFLKRIFIIEMNDQLKLLHVLCRSGSKNIFSVLKFLRETFLNDFESLKEVLLQIDGSGGTFLHHSFRYFNNDTIMRLLEEINEWKSLLGQDFINELVLMRSDDGIFLSRYVDSGYFSNDYFIRFFNQIKLLCDQKTLKKFFFVVGKNSRAFLHDCCYRVENLDLTHVLEWLAQELGNDILTEIFLLNDENNRTIFHFFTSSTSKQTNSGSILFSILRYLRHVPKSFRTEK